MKHWVLRFVLSVVLIGIAPGAAQSQAASQGPAQASLHDLDLTIPATAAWTDSGIDLHVGDQLQITGATLSAASSQGTPDRHTLPQSASSCDPQGVASTTAQGLPLSSAPSGALIGELHAQGAAPFLVGLNKELKVEEQGHLYLSANVSGKPVCQGSFTVKVHVVPAGAAAASSSSGPAAAGSRSAAVKSKLAAAAQTWLSGQFGTSAGTNTQAAGGANAAMASDAGSLNATTTTVVAPALSISTVALDAQLRQSIKQLPRRVNDQFNHLGDMVNFIIIGPQQKVQDVLEAGRWFVADKSKTDAVLNAVLKTKADQDYLQMPMSQLYLFGRTQDFGYEQAEAYAVVASRHHFRLWKAPFEFDGQQVWVGAGTHDIGFEKDQRNGSVTHKIDPAVDGERDHIGECLQKTGKVKSLTYYLPPDAVQDARNATGGGYRSDGRILVIAVQ